MSPEKERSRDGRAAPAQSTSAARNLSPVKARGNERWPVTTVDLHLGREWVHLEPPRFYVYQDPASALWSL